MLPARCASRLSAAASAIPCPRRSTRVTKGAILPQRRAANPSARNRMSNRTGCRQRISDSEPRLTGSLRVDCVLRTLPGMTSTPRLRSSWICFAHIGLHGGWKLIGEIGDRWHGTDRENCDVTYAAEPRNAWNGGVIFSTLGRGAPPLRRQHSGHGEQEPVHELIVHHYNSGIHPIDAEQLPATWRETADSAGHRVPPVEPGPSQAQDLPH